MPDQNGTGARPPESRVVPKKRTRISVVWLIPIVAAIAGGWVAVTRILDQGPKITITFDSAEGLEAGKTKVEYNGVQIGTVTEVRLSEDHLKVISTVQMDPKTDEFLVEDSASGSSDRASRARRSRASAPWSRAPTSTWRSARARRPVEASTRSRRRRS